MLVKIYKDGRDHIGLNIGEANARRYFSRRKTSIELKLDDLRIRCTLPPEFWQGRPEIRDPRLSVWLEFKVARRAAAREPVFLSMVPSGTDSFVIRPRCDKEPESFGADVRRPHSVQSEHVGTYNPESALEVHSVA